MHPHETKYLGRTKPPKDLICPTCKDNGEDGIALLRTSDYSPRKLNALKVKLGALEKRIKLLKGQLEPLEKGTVKAKEGQINQLKDGLKQLGIQQKPLQDEKKKIEDLQAMEEFFTGLLTMKMTQEPDFTTYKMRNMGTQTHKLGITKETIDFIFSTRKDVKCTKILSIPDGNTIGDLKMPNWHYPSDHFAIGADLILTTRAGRRRIAQHDSTKPVRRMAQREFSSRRDSPVMVRLLEEIVEAQDN